MPRTAVLRSWTPTRVGALVALVSGLVILGPALAPGYLLRYDLVFVPHLGFGERVLGLDGTLPRAVPNDLVVAAFSTVLPGWVVQKLLLVVVFVAVGSGVGALASSRVAAAAAAVAATWNPWVGERLGIGHWGYLLGYAALPWVAAAARGARAGEHRGRWRLVAWVGVAGLGGSTALVLAALLALAVLVVPTGSRRTIGPVAVLFGAALLAAGPWLWPAITLAPSASVDPLGAQLFGAGADTPLGVVLSLVTGGGIWNEAAWLPDRRGWVGALTALVAVVLVVALAWRSQGWRRDPAYGGLAVAGVVGLGLGMLGAAPGGTDLLAWLGSTVPGGGLLRDGQKFVALWVLLLAVGSGVAAERIWAAFPSGAVLARGVLAAVPPLLGMVALPGLAWGASGVWRSVGYPAIMTEVAARVDADGGTLAVLPWQTYRRYAWNHDTVVLDPWSRLVRGRVLSSDDLPVSGQVVTGEDPRAAAIARAVRGSGPLDPVLRGQGATHVVIQTDQPGAAAQAARVGGVVVARGTGLELRLLGPRVIAGPAPWWRWVGLLAGLASVVGAVSYLTTRIRSGWVLP